MEDQGIMALPQGMPMQAPTARAQVPPLNPAAEAAFQQARQRISPREFTRTLLNTAEQADPAAVQKLKRILMGKKLPQKLIDALQQAIDMLLADPQNYTANIQRMLAKGLPPNIFPTKFDAGFLMAFKLALDAIEAQGGGAQNAPVQQFAKGGIVNLKPAAKMLREMGRNGDTILAHINPQEAAMLKRMGGSGTINPRTGLPEFGFFDDAWDSFTGAVSDAWDSVTGVISDAWDTVTDIGQDIVDGVKDFAQSTIGKVVLSVALGFFLGPAAAGLLGVTSAAGVAAVSGIVGGFGSSILAGQSLEESVKNGVIGGVTAGLTAGITGGANAFETGSYTGPTTIGGQWDRAVEGVQSLSDAATTANAPTENLAGTSLNPVGTAPQPTLTPEQVNVAQNVVTPSQVSAATPTGPVNVQIAADGSIVPPTSGIGEPVGNVASIPQATDIKAPLLENPNVNTAAQTSAPYTGIDSSTVVPGYSVDPVTGQLIQDKSIFAQAMDTGKGMYNEYIKPLTPSGVTEAARPEAMKAASEAYKQAIDSGLSEQTANALAKDAYNSAMPGVVGKYLPMAAAGVGAMYLGGAFEPPPVPQQKYIPKKTGVDLVREQPKEYGFAPGGATTVYYDPVTGTFKSSAPTGGFYSNPYLPPSPPSTGGPITNPYFSGSNPYALPSPTTPGPSYYSPPRPYARGGIASVSPYKYSVGGYATGGTRQYPRRTGPIDGPGTGTSDSIPAMLSDGEFVMTARAVRGAGDGSRREGARRMYRMMRMLERNG